MSTDGKMIDLTKSTITGLKIVSPCPPHVFYFSSKEDSGVFLLCDSTPSMNSCALSAADGAISPTLRQRLVGGAAEEPAGSAAETTGAEDSASSFRRGWCSLLI